MATSELVKPIIGVKYSFGWLRTSMGMAKVVAIGILYLILFAYSVQVLLDSPKIDFMLEMSEGGDAHIALFTPGSLMWQRGIRIGDRVVVLDGRAPQVEDKGFWFGQRVQVQTKAGDVVVVDASLLPTGRDAWPLLLLSPWFFLFGLLVYKRSQDKTIASATYMLFTSIAFAMAMGPAAVEDRLFITSAEFVTVTLFAPCFLRFFLVFPTYRWTPNGHRAIFIPPLIVSLLALHSFWYPSFYQITSLLRLVVLLGYILVGVVLILYALINERKAFNGISIIAIGTLVSVAPFLGLYLVPMLLFSYPFVEAKYAILALAVLPISFAYAIFRHNILNIALLQRWLIHGIIYAAMVVFYTFVIIEVFRLWFVTLIYVPVIVSGFSALIVIIIGMTFQWFYQRTCRLLDHIFFKDSYDYNAVLQDMSRDLSVARDIDTLGVQLLRTFWELVNVEFAVLLLRDRDNQKELYIHKVVGVGDTEMLMALTKLETSASDIFTITSLPINNQNILAVPLRVHDFIVGYICLGPKVKGEPFRTQDRDLLNTLSAQIAAIIRNTQLVSDLRTKVQTLDALNDRLQHVQEQERARLAADIHDEPLQTAMHLQRQLMVVINQEERVSSIVALSQTLIDQLRNVCTSMRPTALDDLGLIAALDTLAQEQSDRTGVPVFLDIDATVNDLVFSPTIELVLYRAVQEAVNNSLRHAKPKTIRISLREQDRSVQLLITDDGQGFDVPSRLDLLVSQGHLGLVGMHERVQHIGGLLSISSVRGEGTVVRLSIPLERSSHDTGDVG